MAETIEQGTNKDAGRISRSGKYLSFSLADEEYAIGVLKVKEILGLMPVNHLPKAPNYIKGVINLRDKVIPILDMRMRFEMPVVEETDRTCIIVVEVQRTGLKSCWDTKQCGKTECPGYENKDYRCWMVSGTHCRGEVQGSLHEKIVACRECDYYKYMHNEQAVLAMGIIVDSVLDVSTINEEDVEDTPAMSGSMELDFILGIAKQEGRVKILLDIDAALQAHAVKV